MSITWKKNSLNILIPYDGEFALSSTVDPILEAQKWRQQYQTASNWCDRLIILGGGGGFHLNLLDSNKLFGVIEFRWTTAPKALPTNIPYANNFETIQIWRNTITQEPHTRWGIFQFRPAWQNRTIDFMKAHNLLNGQNPESEFFNKLSEEFFV